MWFAQRNIWRVDVNDNLVDQRLELVNSIKLMANFPPLVSEPAKGTKHIRDMKVKSGVCNALLPPRAPLCLLLLILPSLVITAALALEVSVPTTC
jgi:hypothetical protein